MKHKKYIFIAIGSIILISATIVIINHRTPFYTPKKGGWSLGYSVTEHLPSNLEIEKGHVYSLEKMQKIFANSSIIADPFFLVDRDSIFLFFEHKLANKPANIALMKSTDAVNFTFDTIVLDEKFHLSYPYVFKHKGGHYMLPETKRAKKILLYKAHNFPYDWRICDTLLQNVNLKDPSIFLSDSLNFFVASDDNYSLYLYESDSLHGKWKKNERSSPLNYGTEARPGGRIFVNRDGKITIPIQNCTKGYGYGLSLYNLGRSKNGEYNFKLSNKFFLKANENVEEFEGGMHHLDIQKYNDKFFIVYDGIDVQKESPKVFNWKFPLKASYMDAKNYFYRLLH